MREVGVVTIFPEMIEAVCAYGTTARAVAGGRLKVRCGNPRDFAADRRRRVDDRPYGGGPGMVMMAEPVFAAIRSLRREMAEDARVVYLSPQGARLDHRAVRRLAEGPDLILLAGRYEGIDERVIESEVDEEVSIGDYVLSDGELGALVLIEAMVRWLPGVLGNEESALEDSFSANLLDCRHYTRPEVWRGRAAPKTLLGGDHGAVRQWRLRDALERTRTRRPDLLSGEEMDP